MTATSMFNHRFIAIIFLVSMLGSIVPMDVVFATINTSNPQNLPTERQTKLLSILPSFPEDVKRPAPNFSKIDWDKELILPRDEEKYRDEALKLLEQGKAGDATSISKVVRHMSDDEVMSAYNIPLEIQDMVRKYREQKNKTEKMTIAVPVADAVVLAPDLSRELEFNIKQWQDSRFGHALVKDVSEDTSGDLQNIDISKTKKLNIKSLIPSKLKEFDVSLKSLATSYLKSDGLTLSSPKSNTNPINSNESSFLVSRDETSQADLSGKIIEYYDGIEKNPIAYLLYQLSSMQNVDGSFGDYNQYQITAEIAQILSNFGLTNSNRYATIVQFLKNTTPRNTREKAIKARLMKGLNEPYQALINEIQAVKNPDNGYGIKPGFGSDVETTLEVAKALYVTGNLVELSFVLSQIKPDGTMSYYENSKPNLLLMNRTIQSLKWFNNIPVVQDKIDLMLNYLIGKYDSQSKTIPDAELIDELSTLQSLRLYEKNPNLQTEWRSNLLTSNFYLISAGTYLQRVLATFGALAEPDLVITGVTTATTPLINRSPASFAITIKNQGFAPASSLRLYDFIDQFQMGQGISIGDSNFILGPQQEVVITISFANTDSFIGDTIFQFYIEPSRDSDFSNNWKTTTFNFASSPSNIPALPIYYIANKHSIDNNPALNVRWSQKADPNRLNYVIMSRKKGTTNWSFTGINDTWNGAFIYGLFEEGIIYDVTVGVLYDNGQSIAYFSDIAQVKTSANDTLFLGGANGIATINEKPTSGLRISGYYIGVNSSSKGEINFPDLPNGATAGWVNRAQYEKLITKFAVSPDNIATNNIRIFTRLKDDFSPPTINVLQLSPFNSNKVKNQNNLKLMVDIVDNVGLKEADYYYFNPSERVWVYIGSSRAQNGNQAWMDWFVPAGLLGPGYKIKAIAWDFQSNQSLPKESPEFTITDGTLPSGTITVEGLTDNKWVLGETKTISWNINSPNGISSLRDIVMYYGSGYDYFASNYNASNQSISFTVPFRANYVTSYAYIKINLYDNNNNYVSLTSAPFEIVDNSPPPHAPWGIPQTIEFLSTNYPLNRTLQAAYPKTDGSLEVIYTEFDGLYYEASGQHIRLVYRRFNGTDWLDPVIIKDYLYLSGTTLPAFFSDIATVQDSSGGIHVAYVFGAGDDLAGIDGAEVFYAKITGNLLTETKQITSNNYLDSGVKIAVNTQGKVFLTWVGGYNYTDRTGFPALRYVEGNGVSNWDPESQLTFVSSGRPALILENNSPILVYALNDQFYFIKKEANYWTTAVVIDEPSNSVYSSDSNLFALGNNTYDLFFKGVEDKVGYFYNIRHINFSVNNNQSQIIKNDWLVKRDAGESIINYKVVKNTDSPYHLLYVKRKQNQSHAYHGIYDGEDSYFITSLASPYLNVSDSVILYENNSMVTTYFSGYMGGILRQFYNVADYLPTINYKLKLTTPIYNSVVRSESAYLRWTLNDSIGSIYDVYLGEDPNSLLPIATGLTITEKNITDIIKGQTYYWQVVAKNSAGSIYGNIWHFDAGGSEICVVPTAGNWQIESSCILNTSTIAPADIIIAPDAVLTVASSTTLRADFKHNKLLVKKGGGILLKKGATIRQKSP